MSQFENYIGFKNPPFILRPQDEVTQINNFQILANQKDPGKNMDELQLGNFPKSSSRYLRWLYWEPHPDSWLHEFFGSSVIHGLKYISRRRLCMLERIFWVGAFLASLYFSWLMIDQVWARYNESPVIVTFNPMEEETKNLPFPAVTICNKALFSNTKIRELFEEYKRGDDKENTIQKLRLVNALCSSKQSFLKRMGLIKTEHLVSDWAEINKEPSQKTLEGAVKFLYDHTEPCSDLIRVCSWDNKKQNCSDLFRPIVTDYGKCCVFNKIPSQLMLFEKDEVSGVEKRERGWSYADIQEWSKWNYDKGFIIDEDNLKFPLRQIRAGNMYGLSVLIDPGVENSYCQSHDSHGVRILLHTPADMPRITHLGTGLGLDKDIYLKVFPDATVAEASILDFDYNQRKCIFGVVGANLGTDAARPYTRNNCFMTCQRRRIRELCNCTLYYARRMEGRRICDPSIRSWDNECVNTIERTVASNMKRECPNCVYGCNYLKYNTESSESTLLDPENLWGDNETKLPPPWSNHKLSILHIYMGSDMNVPKLRQKLYSLVDLVASIGGLLGLTLGFSVLAAIEIVYLLTLRLCCKRFRNYQMSRASASSLPQTMPLGFPYAK